MNFIPKRCPVICHIEKEGAVSFENERDGINLQKIYDKSKYDFIFK
mgnify:CR=1 FL=1